MNLFVDIPYLIAMMIGMSEYRNLDADSRKVAEPGACHISARGLMSKPEVFVSKTLTVVVAAVLVAALFVGATVFAKDREQSGRNAYQHGIMPEIVVKAHGPRLVMPTVESRAYRALAVTGSGFNVN
jgi:ABC-type amino acid transport system permease subunit